jgi:site-specific DNA-methyltransferase (adenine-specific)|tara:strand:- start:113 stop:856 length:744 start_codon:yes stop_codon:yes gene_type:complete
MKKNKIITGDFLKEIKKCDDEIFDLIICDPPYNLEKDFGIYKESEMRDNWLPWSKLWIDECIRVLRKDGNIFIYGIHKYLCWLQCHLMESELEYRRQIIWKYENGFSGYGKRNLAAFYEPLLWFSKGKNYTYHTIREPYKSKERLKNKITKNGKVWTPHPDGRMAGDIWEFPTLAGKRFAAEKVDHPTQKPMSISGRIVKHFSNEGDLVLVPFAGSGSECLACKESKRDFIGYELNPEYVEIANQRL